MGTKSTRTLFDNANSQAEKNFQHGMCAVLVKIAAVEVTYCYHCWNIPPTASLC